MFQFLSRLFVALAALFALRLVFAAIRRANRAHEPGRPAPPRSDARQGVVKPSRTPRIDPALAEDVPFVEVGHEHERVRKD